jgi:predicted AAA+ superfamily ATPase
LSKAVTSEVAAINPSQGEIEVSMRNQQIIRSLHREVMELVTNVNPDWSQRDLKDVVEEIENSVATAQEKMRPDHG